jgi:histidinol phosphatase-like enzyme
MSRARKSFQSPIPGAGIPPRGLFVDRWGTLLEAPTSEAAAAQAEPRFAGGALDALFTAGQLGWEIYLIGNEESVAFGKLSVDAWREFEQAILARMRAHGVLVKRCYACLDHPRGVKGRARDSVFLLPNTGILYHAAQFDGISLAHSWVVGDGTLELVSGWRAGCHVAGVGRPATFQRGELSVDPDLVEPTLAAVLGELRARVPVPGR